MHCYKSTGNAYERSNHMIHFNTNISVKEIGQRLCPLKRHFGGQKLNVQQYMIALFTISVYTIKNMINLFYGL